MVKVAGASVGLFVLAVVLASACSTNGGSADKALGDVTARSAPARSASPRWLFAVQSEGESTFDAATGRLSIPSDLVQAFTDRPYRDSRSVAPQALANLFHRGGANSFTADPPNAVLTYWDTSTGTPTPRTAVCEATGAGVSSGRLWVGLKVTDPAGATLPVRLPRASLFVDDVPLGGCPSSPSDEAIVEYFNEIAFGQEIHVNVADTGPAFQLSLSCPPRLTPDVPSADMAIRMATGDGSSTVSCNTGIVSIPKSTLTRLPYCTATHACVVDVTVLDGADGDVFSTTEVEVPLNGGNDTLIPNLNPAVLPICPQALDQCLLTGTCAPAKKTGWLGLCGDAATCTHS